MPNLAIMVRNFKQKKKNHTWTIFSWEKETEKNSLIHLKDILPKVDETKEKLDILY